MGSGKDTDEDGKLDGDASAESDADDLESDDFEATIVMNTDDDDDVDPDTSAEINIEELVAKFEAAESDDVERKRAIRRRLEQLAEERDIDLDSTYNFNLADD